MLMNIHYNKNLCLRNTCACKIYLNSVEEVRYATHFARSTLRGGRLHTWKKK